MTIDLITAKALRDYFLFRAGYISYEFDPHVHLFIAKLTRYIDEEEEKNSTETIERRE